MVARCFHIATPDQLRELAAFVKDGKLSPIITIWKSAKQRQGSTRWDIAIFAIFSGDKRRTAEVLRISAMGERVTCATLRYDPALAWCEKNLGEVRQE